MTTFDEEFPYSPDRTGSWLICTACGTQFPTSNRQQLTTCFICDDPRQFTPQTGQAFTTLKDLRSSGHKNTWTAFPAGLDGQADDRFTSIVTEPKVAIGQRAVLIRTPSGNVLWDCITYLDDDTVSRIKELGGLLAIVISHPHYYSTHLEWARAFDCPVYLATEDNVWLTQRSVNHQVFISETETSLKHEGRELGVTVLKLGGHFPGSFVALYDGRLLVADTFVTSPAGLGSWETNATGQPRDEIRASGRTQPKNMNSFSFLWSIPNMIPLSPNELLRMWAVVKQHEFRSSHGAFLKTDIVGREPFEMRRRVLESMQIQTRYSGHLDHAILRETVD